MSATGTACVGLWLAVLFCPAWAASVPRADGEARRTDTQVDFKLASPSAEVRRQAELAVRTGDHEGLPFIVVDKRNARVYLFSATGTSLGDTPALLGLAIGDESVPGIGQRKLSTILPEERTTPAGRFVAELDKNMAGEVILWVDYHSAISLHPLRKSRPSENRVARLASQTSTDNRISYGCINVSPEFFRRFVVATFTGTQGIVYILPEALASNKIGKAVAR